jgi:Carboxypeptidase regulatory-like domain
VTRILLALTACLALVAAVRADQHQASPVVNAATVTGVVRANAGGQPAAHAMVLIAGTDIGLLRVTSTDGGGRFTFTGLPAGRFLLGAGKPAYLAALYGAGRPGRPGTEITLAAGQKLPDVALDLLKGAVISGHVLDDEGQPIVGARVRVLTRRDVGDEVVLGADAGDPFGAITDDRGAYRIFDLIPGDYVVALQPRGLGGLPLAYSSIYFPSSPRANDASTIHLAAGAERDGVDLRASIVPLARVEGVVTGMAPGANVQIVMRPASQRAAGTVLNSQTTRPGPDGRFAFGGVAPGEYEITARTLAPPGPPESRAEPFAPEWATDRVVVESAPPAPRTLALQPALSISGRLAFEGLKSPPDDVNFRIGVRPTPGSGVPNTPGPVLMDKDGNFTIADLTPGRYRLFVVVPANNVTQVPDWFAETAIAGDRDALDVPLALGPDVHDVTIVMTDDAPEIAGAVHDAKGGLVRNCSVIAFPVDRELAFPQSRRIAVRQCGENGQFVFGLAAGLPPGEYYVAALPDLGPNEQFDSVLLEELARSAARVTLAAGDSKTVNVSLARPARSK